MISPSQIIQAAAYMCQNLMHFAESQFLVIKMHKSLEFFHQIEIVS